MVVCGAISPQRGRVYFKYGIRSFKAVDVADMFAEIRKVIPKPQKLAIFLDNARIHSGDYIRELVKPRRLDIRLIFNVPYRPDMMGVEFAWADIKRRYRKWVCQHKARGTVYDHRALVEDVIDTVPNDVLV